MNITLFRNNKLEEQLFLIKHVNAIKHWVDDNPGD